MAKGLEILRGIFILVLLCISSVVVFIPIIIIALVKLIPFESLQKFCGSLLEVIATGWMYVNTYGAALLLPTKFEVQGLEEMKKDGSYLLMVNHQSWMDIMVLENIFLGKISFAKFFLKNELKWVPILGLAWWAMDFPFMKRYSKAYLKKHPEKQGKDMEATRKACEKFKHMPLTLVNFSEGTRFTAAKAKKQESPYKNLLKPRAGGVSLVMNVMGAKMDSIIDVTIYYPSKYMTMWDYLSGRIKNIKIDIRYIPITKQMHGNMQCADFVQYIRGLVNNIWQHKDDVMERFKSEKIEDS
jgi:1-acyl-sn-glycerol-3-phosphate acyltransferase